MSHIAANKGNTEHGPKTLFGRSVLMPYLFADQNLTRYLQMFCQEGMVDFLLFPDFRLVPMRQCYQ